MECGYEPVEWELAGKIMMGMQFEEVADIDIGMKGSWRSSVRGERGDEQRQK